MKVIKDRDERPKGFGYVEFEGLDDLKGALAQSGTVRTFIPSTLFAHQTHSTARFHSLCQAARSV